MEGRISQGPIGTKKTKFLLNAYFGFQNKATPNIWKVGMELIKQV